MLSTTAAAVVAAVAAPAAANAARADTLFVGQPGSGPGRCAAPAYTSVQSAVDAAPPGATVYLCGHSPMAEQVVVSKTITLTGARGAGLTAPAASAFATSASGRLPGAFQTDSLVAPQALLVVTGGRPTITGLGFSGPLPGNGGCGSEEYGILVLGGMAVIEHDSVVNIHDVNTSLIGCQFGIGIQVGSEYWPQAGGGYATVDFAGRASIDGTTVSGYQKNGIDVDGPGSDGLIVRDTVLGSGRDDVFAPIIAQNGIQISRGAHAAVGGSLVAGNSYTGKGEASAAGILIYGGCGDPVVTGARLVHNTLTNNDVGILMADFNSGCSSYSPQATSDTALDNTISDNAVSNVSGYCDASGNCPGDGYQAGIEDIGNTDVFIGNVISGRGYAPAGSLADPAPAFVRPIDTISYPTLHPLLLGNSYHP